MSAALTGREPQRAGLRRAPDAHPHASGALGRKAQPARARPELGVSRSPVHHALTRLVSEGLLTVARVGLLRHPRHGTAVAEGYDVRLALELLAAERSVGALDAAQLARFRELLEATAAAISHEQWDTANAAFHEYQIDLADNALLSRFYRELSVNLMMQVIRGGHVEGHADLVTEHRRIVEAFAARRLGGGASARSASTSRPAAGSRSTRSSEQAASCRGGTSRGDRPPERTVTGRGPMTITCGDRGRVDSKMATTVDAGRTRGRSAGPVTSLRPSCVASAGTCRRWSRRLPDGTTRRSRPSPSSFSGSSSALSECVQKRDQGSSSKDTLAVLAGPTSLWCGNANRAWRTGSSSDSMPRSSSGAQID